MKSLHDQICCRAEAAQDEVIDVCSRLIQFPTVNPPGSTRDIVEYIATYFASHNMSTEVIQRSADKSNLCLRLPGKKAGKLLWLGHLDVVPPGDTTQWSLDPFSGLFKDGRIYGRGASDMKGSCAAAMVAATLLQDIDPEHHCTIEFWFTCDEETGATDGVRWLSETGQLTGDACLIGDSMGDLPHHPAIDIGCKGYLRPHLRVHGHTAHGSQPFLGHNAIRDLLQVTSSVKQIEQFPLTIPAILEPVLATSLSIFQNLQSLNTEQIQSLKRVFHYPTASLNMIAGGVKVNVVPDSAEATFDVRITPGTPLDCVKTQIRRLVKQSGVEKVIVEFQDEGNGYFENSASPFVQNLIHTIHTATNVLPKLKLLTGGTDAIPLKASTSIPCLGFGVGIEGKAHVHNEYVTPVNLVLGTKVYALLPLLFTPMST
jgi:succinyl-diaminopimelate desuccinylase